MQKQVKEADDELLEGEEEAVEVDESLFEDMDELGLDDDFNPDLDTWHRPIWSGALEVTKWVMADREGQLLLSCSGRQAVLLLAVCPYTVFA